VLEDELLPLKIMAVVRDQHPPEMVPFHLPAEITDPDPKLPK